MLILKILILSFMSCMTEKNGDCADFESLNNGEMRGELNGEEWTPAETEWVISGSSVQLTTSTDNGWRLSIVAQRTVNGDSLGEKILKEGELEIDLSAEGGGWVVAYPASGPSFSTRSDGNGSLLISNSAEAIEEGILQACIEFEAKSGDEKLELKDGVIRANQLAQ